MNKLNIENFSKEDLLELNQQIGERLKLLEKEEMIKASKDLSIGSLVSFQHNNAKHTAVVVVFNKKTIKVITTKNYEVSVPPAYLDKVKKPSKKLLDLKEELFPTIMEVKTDKLLDNMRRKKMR